MNFAFLNDPEVVKRIISGIIIFFDTSVLSFVAERLSTDLMRYSVLKDD